jgi:hypothetical protein
MNSLLELIADIPTNANLRLQVKALEEKVVHLEQQNAALVKENAKLVAQVSASAAASQFVDCHGALFKRKVGGGFDSTVYCFKCRTPMVAFNIYPYYCSACGYEAPFGESGLSAVLRELPGG